MKNTLRPICIKRSVPQLGHWKTTSNCTKTTLIFTDQEFFYQLTVRLRDFHHITLFLKQRSIHTGGKPCECLVSRTMAVSISTTLCRASTPFYRIVRPHSHDGKLFSSYVTSFLHSHWRKTVRVLSVAYNGHLHFNYPISRFYAILSNRQASPA